MNLSIRTSLGWIGVLLLWVAPASGWTPLAVTNDMLVRMPGTQPGEVVLETPGNCFNCHANYAPVEPGTNWHGSMMAQSARDPLFWATMAVAAQDSVWALGTPNAADLCLRCHFPQGWLEGRSDPPNATLMRGTDYDGVHCTVCHSMMDPFFQDTFAGIREGSDWTNYWDEVGSVPRNAASNAVVSDRQVAAVLKFMNGMGFYTNNRPVATSYTENAGGQMFMNVSGNKAKRASFADANANHEVVYSRYHKSKYFCSTCHDVSNPVLANLGADPNNPLPSETKSAFSYAHVERTFSEFMLSAFGAQDGAPGTGAFAPEVLVTSRTNNWITSCQDCHMRDGVGRGCDKNSGILRPSGSTAHPNSGVPIHDMTGGNAWIPRILASTATTSPNYDPTNRALLFTPGPTVLTLDLTQGNFKPSDNPRALIAAAQRAEVKLQQAATITNLAYNPYTGEASFRIVNHTGHKLISGYPEGRRIFANIVLRYNNQIVHEVNPYDTTAGTLKGLSYDYSPNSPPLAPHESHRDELVYEAKMTSAITGEETTFHFALATGRYKDNRIPPRGFRYQEAGQRISEPVWQGVSSTNLFTPEEYAGGYRNVSLTLAPGATQMVVRLFYQTTSREYIEFLRDEINGVGGTLTGTGAGGDPPYIAQNDPWFSKLKAWGDTIWQLWEHNKNLPGAAPIHMASSSLSVAYEPPLLRTLAVYSAHGNPMPHGIITNDHGSVITGAVEAVITQGGTQFVNTGWTMIGNEPQTGNQPMVVLTLTNDAVLTWNWNTNYWLEALAADHGNVNVTSDWMAAGSTADLTALASNYYDFSHWTHDVPPELITNNPVALLMDGAKVVAAVFVERLAANNVPEWWLALYYPDAEDMDEAALSDSDLDGIQAWAEYIAGTDPTDPSSVLRGNAASKDGMIIIWPSISGRLYSIQYTTNLLLPFITFTSGSNMPATPDWNYYTNTTMTNEPILLYRIGVRRAE
ncbi:MAG TPA: hypothetical protein PKE26_16800 [Kiritimatiellia bacterium]|nr:hypothetical protein [Kiritimatiellia bacterium]HMP00757.1 hypothetical protein [Kiritimatiellia bacterium]